LLVDEYPEENGQLNAADDFVLLCSQDDAVETDLLVALLNSSGIPTLLKRHESGAYLHIIMGRSIFGVNVHVPSSQVVKARELLSDLAVAKEADIPEDSFTEFMEKEKAKRQIRNGVIVLIAIVPVFCWTTVMLLSFLREILFR